MTWEAKERCYCTLDELAPRPGLGFCGRRVLSVLSMCVESFFCGHEAAANRHADVGGACAISKAANAVVLVGLASFLFSWTVTPLYISLARYAFRYWLHCASYPGWLSTPPLLPFSLAQAEAPQLLCIDGAMLLIPPPVPHAFQLCLDALFCAGSGISLNIIWWLSIASTAVVRLVHAVPSLHAPPFYCCREAVSRWIQ